MSKAKKNDDVSKKKLVGSLPILIQFGKTKYGSANKNLFKDDEKKEEVEFIVGSYNPKNYNNFIQQGLKEKKSIKSNDNIDFVGEGNVVNSTIEDEMIFGDLEI